MEWLTSIRTAIDYMEEHLTDNMIRYRRIYQEPKAVPSGVGSEGDG